MLTTETSRHETNPYPGKYHAARPTIPQTRQDRIQAKHTIVEDVEELWQGIKDDSTEKMKLCLWSLRSELYAVLFIGCVTVDSSTARITQLVEGFHMVAAEGSKTSPSKHLYVSMDGTLLDRKWTCLGKKRNLGSVRMSCLPCRQITDDFVDYRISRKTFQSTWSVFR